MDPELVGIDQIEDEKTAELAREELVKESERPFELSAERIEAERELIKRAEGKYSPEEVKNFITMGKKLAAKPVLSMLCDMIQNYEGDAKEQKRLIELVKGAIPYNFCGNVTCEFDEINWKLVICLSLVPRTYTADIIIPDEKYGIDLYRQYEFLRQIAIAYWAQFIEEHNGLFRRVCEYMKKIDIAELKVDPKNLTTLYLDPLSKSRVGIFPFYVDAKGNPLKKR